MLRPFAHPVACCWMLLRVFAQSLKPAKLFSQQLPTFLLFQLFQHCWGHEPSLRMDYKDLWVVLFPRCTAGPKLVGSCCIPLHTTANTHATTLLGVVAPVCTQLRLYTPCDLKETKSLFKGRATAVPNSIDWIKFDFNTAVARRLKPSHPTAV